MDEIDLVAKTLEVHEIVWVSHEDGYLCGCDDRGLLDRMITRPDALRHVAGEVLTALGRKADR